MSISKGGSVDRYTMGSGAPSGTGTNGYHYYDLTNKREYLSDGVGWVIIAEQPVTSYVPTVTSTGGTITTVGTKTLHYHRCDGYLDFYIDIAITTNGTGSGAVQFTLPIQTVAANAAGLIGSVREILVNGNICSISSANSGNSADILFYNNTYPGSSGCRLVGTGRYRMTTRYS